MSAYSDPSQYQWAVLEDPDGAAFGLIPAVSEELENETSDSRHGCIAWLSLSVPNASASQEYYQRVMGWNSKTPDSAGDSAITSRFEMGIEGDISVAEILQFQDQDNDIPQVWLIHVPVDDLGESLRRVGDCGGQVIKECPETKSAIVRDPIGVHLALQAGS